MRINTSWQLIDRIGAPVLALDRSRVIQHVNPAVLGLFGSGTAEELIGRDFNSFLGADQATVFDLYFESLDLTPRVLNLPISSLSGELIPVLVTGTLLPSEEGDADFVLITLERKGLVQELKMDELDLLNELNKKANLGQGIIEILNIFEVESKSKFGAISVHVFLLEPDSYQLQTELLSPTGDVANMFRRVLNLEVPDSLTVNLDESSLFRGIVEGGESVVIKTPETIQKFLKELLSDSVGQKLEGKRAAELLSNLHKMTGIGSIAMLPLVSGGKIIGLVDLVLPYVCSENDLETIQSITDQVCVIVQRLQVEKEKARHLREIEFISRTLADATQEDDVDVLCSRLAENVLMLNPDVYVMVSLYDPDLGGIRVRALHGLGKLANKIIRMLGKPPEQVVIKSDGIPLDDELNEKYTSGKLENVPGGLFDFTRGALPARICKSIEKVAGIGEVYIVGFGLEGVSTGGLILLVKEGAELQFSDALELVANHYAVVFGRRIGQQEIQRGKAQLEALRKVELEITSQLDLEVLLQRIAEEARSIVDAVAVGFSIYNPEREVLEYLAYTGENELPKNSDVARGEGLAGKVLDKKETVIVGNYPAWEDKLEDWAAPEGYHLAGIPVMWSDEVLGVLEVALEDNGVFTLNNIEMLELFAIQAAIAVKNARLFQEELMRRHEAETLREVGLLINRLADRDVLMDKILSELQKVVPYRSASVKLVRGDRIVVEAFRSTEDLGNVVGESIEISHSPAAKSMLHEGDPVVLRNENQVRTNLRFAHNQGAQSWVGVPLEIMGNRIGYLTLDHQEPDQYSERDVQLLLSFAAQAVIALENNRLFDESLRRTQEIEAVYDSAMKLSQELQPDLLFEHLQQQIDKMFDQDACLLATYDANKQMIGIEYATEAGARQRHAEKVEIPITEKKSLLSWIIRKKTSLMIGNVETDSLPVQPEQKGKIVHSWLGVPLLVGKRVIGALVLQAYRPNAFKYEDQRLLELLGNQVAKALENSRLFSDSQRRLSRLASLREIDMAISGSVDIEMTMDVLVGHLVKSLHVDAACVLAYDPLNRTLDFICSRGFRTRSLRNASLRLGEGLAGKAALERSIVHIPDLLAQHTSLEKSSEFHHENFVTYLAHPLIAKGELVGVLEVFNHERIDPDPEWINFLDALARVAGIAIDRMNLFEELSRSNFELQQAYDATIEGWASAIEMRDNNTSNHSRRVVTLTVKLARMLGVSGEDLTHMRRGAMLHDIGKMAIPDGILMKNGTLTEDEWRIMKKHPRYAYDMLSGIDYLKLALDIPYCHHERWDGSGYPRGVAGEEIPLAARIFAVVDVWDALQSNRSYREAWSEEQAVNYIREQSGAHFDPEVVCAFLDLIKA